MLDHERNRDRGDRMKFEIIKLSQWENAKEGFSAMVFRRRANACKGSVTDKNDMKN